MNTDDRRVAASAALAQLCSARASMLELNLKEQPEWAQKQIIRDTDLLENELSWLESYIDNGLEA